MIQAVNQALKHIETEINCNWLVLLAALHKINFLVRLYELLRCLHLFIALKVKEIVRHCTIQANCFMYIDTIQYKGSVIKVAVHSSSTLTLK